MGEYPPKIVPASRKAAAKYLPSEENPDISFKPAHEGRTMKVGTMKGSMTHTATDALQKIRALRKYDLPQTRLAEQKILKNLNLDDLAEVVKSLEEGGASNG